MQGQKYPVFGNSARIIATVFLLLFFPFSGHSSTVDDGNDGTFETLKSLADGGDANAQNNLGVLYHNGFGTSQNYEQAVIWYKKAADQGLAIAQYNLGYMYMNGYGVAKDYSQAAILYRNSADSGYDKAQGNLGYMYMNGYGVERNPFEGLKWTLLALVSPTLDADDRSLFFKNRSILTKKLNKDQIIAAQDWYSEWKPIPTDIPVTVKEATTVSTVLSAQANEKDNDHSPASRIDVLSVTTDTDSSNESLLNTKHLIDVATNPITDPLFANPSQLDDGKLLPGDSELHVCDKGERNNAIPLALSEAIDLAMCHNTQVQSTWASIKVQSAQVGEARAAYLPTINVGISRLNQKIKYPESQFASSSDQINNSRYFNLTWRLLDFGGRDANRRSANALLAAAVASHDAVLQSTFASVVGQYFDAQTARANQEARAKSEDLARQTMETAKKRESRGAGAQSDTLQAMTALAKAELENSRAIGAYEKSLAVLVVSLGLPTQSPKELRLAIDYMDSENSLRQDLSEWLALAKEQHPALMAARAQLESAKEKLVAVRSEGLPTIDFTQSQYVNGRPNQGLSSTQTEENVFGLNVNFPLFDGFARTYKVRGAQAEIEVKEAALRDTQNQILSEIVKVYADATSALRNLESSERLLGAAQSALDNVRHKYEKGAADILEMLNVQTALADAGQERVRTLSEWRSARLRLLANAGILGRNAVTH